jgi:hypothetical protein
VIGTGVTAIGISAFSSALNLKNVTIGDNVTSIGNSAFYFVDGITTDPVTSLTLPSSLEQIGASAFYNCKFTSLTIPASVQTIGDNAFNGCSNMVTLTFAEGSQCTTIGASAFQSCGSLTTVEIPDSVTTLGTGTELNTGGVFQFCSSLTSVTLGTGITTLKPTTFYYCSALESIEIPDGVTSIGDGAFELCSSLQSVTLGTGVQTIRFLAFNSCSALTTLTVKSNIVSSNFMNTHFHDSINSLQTLVLGGDVITVGGPLDGENNGAFAYCANLESVTIGANITTINPNAFVNCAKLAITFLENSDGSFNSALQTIGNQAFAYCNGLTKLTLPPSVTTLGNGAFYDCDNLTEVSLHKNVTSLGQSNNAFSASALNTLNLTTGNGLGLSAGPNQTIGGRPGVTVKIVSDFKGSYNPPILKGDIVIHNQGDTKTHNFIDRLGSRCLLDTKYFPMVHYHLLQSGILMEIPVSVN